MFIELTRTPFFTDQIFKAFQQFSEKAIEKIKKRIEQEKKKLKKEEDQILCKFCQNKITSMTQIINVNGQYRHTFTNPSGITFQIGCFSSANGCIIHGKPTLDFTWFDGFSWNFSLCSNCHAHLGWHYNSSENINFFGLILDHLV